ncbi:MAG TPA: hypothetical protein VFC78_21710 [Tepidisphaeraceae bacterium]|nr:hypothetical protein [Tepidisphaeraceae bacterium]
MPQEMSFAQALTEAKQVIVQQASRIKGDAEKLRVQQEMLMNQGNTIAGQEQRIKEQAADIERLAGEITDLTGRLAEAVTAREQAETVINRQGERITTLEHQAQESERLVAGQIEQIADLRRERESLIERLPTQKDADALAAMSSLLMKKVAGAGANANARPAPTMRLAEAA